ncbi:hypothetical protein KSP39_PZI018578 [Platanthera zijinensis]|uniref:Uncharacterized protein n=1 Tax=Platanthera zijinensis TaxID=2320716 RepID=A0AAP0B2Z8_9ASPA
MTSRTYKKKRATLYLRTGAGERTERQPYILTSLAKQGYEGSLMFMSTKDLERWKIVHVKEGSESYDYIVLVDEPREGVNAKLESWRDTLERKGFMLSSAKTEYMELEFSSTRRTDDFVINLRATPEPHSSYKWVKSKPSDEAKSFKFQAAPVTQVQVFRPPSRISKSLSEDHQREAQFVTAPSTTACRPSCAKCSLTPKL